MFFKVKKIVGEVLDGLVSVYLVDIIYIFLYMVGFILSFVLWFFLEEFIFWSSLFFLGLEVLVFEFCVVLKFCFQLGGVLLIGISSVFLWGFLGCGKIIVVVVVCSYFGFYLLKVFCFSFCVESSGVVEIKLQVIFFWVCCCWFVVLLFIVVDFLGWDCDGLGEDVCVMVVLCYFFFNEDFFNSCFFFMVVVIISWVQDLFVDVQIVFFYEFECLFCQRGSGLVFCGFLLFIFFWVRR